jgi:Na+/H+ antiporter NhaC
MIVAFVIVLLLIIIIFGVDSMMQSYASAQQAQAVIETAKAAQVSAWGNVVSILALIGFIVILLALVAAALWWLGKRKNIRTEASESKPRVGATPTMPVFDVNALIQLEMIRTLQSLHAPTERKYLLTDEPMSLPEIPEWLRR